MAHLHIIDISKNADTGLITMEARIIDAADTARGTGEVLGAVERFHVEALDIEKNYGGDVERWLQHKGREMLHRHKLRTATHSDIGKWHGQRMEIK